MRLRDRLKVWVMINFPQIDYPLEWEILLHEYCNDMVLQSQKIDKAFLGALEVAGEDISEDLKKVRG